MKRMISEIAFALPLSANVWVAPPQTYTLSIAPDGGLAGTGAGILKSQIVNAQFILYGEDHGFADSPILLRTIAHEAKPYGFKYLVEEVGPLSIRMIRDTLANEGLSGLHKVVHEVPLGDTQGIEKLTPTARFILLGYDYVITTPDAKAGISLY